MASTSAESVPPTTGTPAAQHNLAFVREADARWESVGVGVRRQILTHTDDLMVVRVDFEAGAIGKLHHHPHRQISYVADGKFRVQMGDQFSELQRGDSFLALANVPHGVEALEAGTLIDCFTPARLDFLSAPA